MLKSCGYVRAFKSAAIAQCTNPDIVGSPSIAVQGMSMNHTAARLILSPSQRVQRSTVSERMCDLGRSFQIKAGVIPKALRSFRLQITCVFTSSYYSPILPAFHICWKPCGERPIAVFYLCDTAITSWSVSLSGKGTIDKSFSEHLCAHGTYAFDA